MNEKNEFLRFGLNKLGFKSKQDLIENLYLQTIIDTYKRIDKSMGFENDIRDRFVKDISHGTSRLSKLIQSKIIFINWERWIFKDKDTLGRTDISFSISGFDYTIECKRLENASQKYIDEGLYRFINGEYASNESFAGMIGFVIKGSATTISTSLEQKCVKTHFANSEFTRSALLNFKNSFKTSHLRKNLPSINIHHLFFEFLKNG